jgi:hypothetical protein
MPKTSPDDLRLLLTRARLAWALHEWRLLLHQATTSEYAARYQYAAATVVRSLDAIETMHDLVHVFFSPGVRLKTLVLTLCMEEEIVLFPHVLLGASCALRLRQLLAQAATSDSA